GTCSFAHKQHRVREAKLLTVQSTYNALSQGATKGLESVPAPCTEAWAVAAEDRALTEELARCSIVSWWPLQLFETCSPLATSISSWFACWAQTIRSCGPVAITSSPGLSRMIVAPLACE